MGVPAPFAPAPPPVQRHVPGRATPMVARAFLHGSPEAQGRGRLIRFSSDELHERSTARAQVLGAQAHNATHFFHV